MNGPVYSTAGSVVTAGDVGGRRCPPPPSAAEDHTLLCSSAAAADSLRCVLQLLWIERLL